MFGESNRGKFCSGHWIEATYNNISSFDFTYGVTGTNSNSTGSRGTKISNIVYFENVDTDGDGLADHVDLDSDNDGIPDAIEACGDITLSLEDCMLDSNGDATYLDSDMDGCPDGLVSTACGTSPIDTDMDGIADFLDLDSDGDGCSDNIEAGTDALGTSDTSGYIAGMVDVCGLLTSGISGICPIPSTIAYRDSNLSTACVNITCDLLTMDPDSFCTYVLANPMDSIALADCDNGGIDNVTECINGGDPSDDCDDSPPTLICPANQTITGTGCDITLTNYTTDVSLINACTDTSIYTFTQSPIDSTALANGIYTVTLTVTDINNNTTDCTFFVEIDLIPPPVPTISGN